MNVKVACKYNNWHYTNGVTHIALMELADKTGAKKYDDYVLKNMNFVFNDGNLEFFKKQYDRAMEDEGWYGVRKLSWHMIFRGKRLDDNGPMGASLIDLQMKHPNGAFLNYINETAEHLNYGDPVWRTVLLPVSGPMKIPFGQMMLSWPFLSFPVWLRCPVT